MRRLTVLSAVLALGAALTAVPAVSAAPGADPSATKIAPQVRHQLSTDADGRVDALVMLNARPNLQSVQSHPDKVSAALKQEARTSQAPVVDAVQAGGDQTVNSLWLGNMVLVHAKRSTLDRLARLDVVERIIPNATVKAGPAPKSSARTARKGGATWGVEKIGANRAQEDLHITGKGVRVAVLDTGIDITHPDLKGRLATDNAKDTSYPGGWLQWNAEGQPIHSTPHDTFGHGTHVSGTIAGGHASGTQIGVAPDATLMHGLVLPGGSGTDAQVIAGMEWAIAPYDANGEPAGQPADVLSMSLGTNGPDPALIQPVRDAVTAGVFPVIAAGNSSDGSSGSPGDVFESLSVGATDSQDDVASFSSGLMMHKSDWTDPPADWPDSYLVPDVSAPGVGVISAFPGGGYAADNGTSMATPHVAGTVALMLQQHPGLSVDQARQTLIDTSVFHYRNGDRPNSRYGWGRIDAYGALSALRTDSGVRGTITDDAGKPVANVAVTEQGGGTTRYTDDQGRFELREPAGTYTLTIDRFGYTKQTVDHVEVDKSAFADVSRTLRTAPRGGISGTVTYGPTGSTVPGVTVHVVDELPEQPATNTDDNGSFTLGVPEGTYHVVASRLGAERSAVTEVKVSADGTAHADFSLPRAPSTRGLPDGSPRDAGPHLSADGHVVVFERADETFHVTSLVEDLTTGATEPAAVAMDGGTPNAQVRFPEISADGRYVVFSTDASNLVPGDTNGTSDVFVRDRTTGTTERVSVATDGTQGNGFSGGISESLAISGDGRYVAFTSGAGNLVAGDTNDAGDAFVHDRQTHVTERVSVTSDGAQSAPNGAASQANYLNVSDDGRYVAFQSGSTNLIAGETDPDLLEDVFVRDRVKGTTLRVSAGMNQTIGNGYSSGPDMTPDGRYVAFSSSSTNLVPDDSGAPDVFVRDLQTGTSTRVSVSSKGEQGNLDSLAPAISADGQRVAFESYADNLVPNDTNGAVDPFIGDDVFVHDIGTGTTERESVTNDGEESTSASTTPTISADGNLVVFQSVADNLDPEASGSLYVRDLSTTHGPEPRFALWDLQVTPLPVVAGGTYTVTAKLKNFGDQAGSYTAVLNLKSRSAELNLGRQTLSLEPGGSSSVSFAVHAGGAGTETVSLNGLKATVTVTPAP